MQINGCFPLVGHRFSSQNFSAHPYLWDNNVDFHAAPSVAHLHAIILLLSGGKTSVLGWAEIRI